MFGTARTVAVRYRADVSGYVAGMRQAQAATSDFAKRAQTSATKQKADWDKIGTAAMAGGLAIGAGVALAIKKAADFEQSMSRVGAVTDATSSEMKALSDAALQAGQDTVFSATEAAAAQEELAKAGVSTSDILGGALTGALDLAAAGGIDLASAAETAAQAMNLFNLEGKDVAHIADVLTSGANKSAAGVKDLGDALQQGGTVAAATGLSLEETVAALSMFADYGIKGSDAGTSLKTMLQRLVPTTTEASKMMDHLGITAFDASGEFVGLEKFAGSLQTSMKDLTDEQRLQAMQTIFGSDAVRAANILFQEGAEGAAEYEKAMNDVGAAQRMAARMTDNLKGDFEGLSGALETALIKTGSGGTDTLRSWVQGLESVVNAYNNLPKSAQSATLTLGATAAAILLVGGGAMKATTSVLAFKASLDATALSGARATAALKFLGAAVAVVGTAWAAAEIDTWVQSARYAEVGAEDLSKGLLDLAEGGKTATAGLEQMYRTDGSKWWKILADDGPITAADALDRFAWSAEAALGDSVSAKFERVTSWADDMSVFEEQVSAFDEALASMVQNGQADQAAAAFEQMMSHVDPEVVDETRAKFTEYQAALDTAQVSANGVGLAIEGVNDDLDSNKDGLVDAAEAAENYQKQLTGLADKIAKMGGGLRGERAAIRDYAKAHEEAKKAIKGTVDEQDAALENMAQSALDVASSQIEMGRSTDDVAARMSTARAQFIDTAVAMGYSKGYAKDLADAMGLVPSDVTTQMSVVGVEGATAEVLGLRESIRLTNGKTVTVKEEGASPSEGRVRKMDGAIFGLKGKTVTVTEIGATASGDRVVRFQGKVYALRGKTVDIGVNTAGASAALAAVQAGINALQGKTITITTQYRSIGGGGEFADGGIRSYARGGFDGSFRTAQPQIRPAGGGGVQWAEEGAGPWEAFISGHPAKRDRSQAIWLETGKKLGLIEAMASGGVYGDWQAELRKVKRLDRKYPLRINKNGTARWTGSREAPADVAAAIARLNAAQERYQDAKGGGSKRSKPRALGPEVGGGDGIGLPKLGSYRYPGRGNSDRSVSSQNYISGRAGGGGVDTAAITRAITQAMTGWRPMVRLGDRELYGVMQRVTDKQKGR